mgnify:CR=1 FL=1
MIQRVVYINYIISLLTRHVVDIYEALFDTKKDSSISAVDKLIDFLNDLKNDLKET